MSAPTRQETRAFVRATLTASFVTAAAFVPFVGGFDPEDYWAMQIWLPAYAAFFGYVGAACFLWPAFAVASLVRVGRWDYPVAGLFAGIATLSLLGSR